tara:strand:- start:92 stop:442 length:351 start_codon:yes stop_codon:yes gene_type:complete
MEKFLFFTDGDTVDAVGDMACYPLSSFLGFTVAAADTTSLGMRFVSAVTGPGATTEIDTVDLTITAAKHKKVVKSITKAINSASFADPSGFIVIADQLNSVFCDGDITACAITHDS